MFQIRARVFATAHEASQYAEAAGGEAVRLNGQNMVVRQTTADRLAARCVTIGFPIFTLALVLGAIVLARTGIVQRGVVRPEYVLAVASWLAFGVLLVARVGGADATAEEHNLLDRRDGGPPARVIRDVKDVVGAQRNVGALALHDFVELDFDFFF